MPNEVHEKMLLICWIYWSVSFERFCAFHQEILEKQAAEEMSSDLVIVGCKTITKASGTSDTSMFALLSNHYYSVIH